MERRKATVLSTSVEIFCWSQPRSRRARSVAQAAVAEKESTLLPEEPHLASTGGNMAAEEFPELLRKAAVRPTARGGRGKGGSRRQPQQAAAAAAAATAPALAAAVKEKELDPLDLACGK